jgi:hypothetical protein
MMALVLFVKQMPFWFRMSLPGTSKRVNRMELLSQQLTTLSNIRSKTLSKLETPLQALAP